MRVSTNVSSMNAQKYLRQHTEERALEDSKLSSGIRITQSSVDPAGLAISELMRAKIRSNFQAERNSNDSISLIQVAEGSIGTMEQIGSRLRELAMQAATDTVGAGERAIIDTEFQQLKQEIERITLSTSFNGNNIIRKGSTKYDLQIGINGTSEYDKVTYDMSRAMDASNNFGIGSIDLKTKFGAQQSLSSIDKMMGQLGASRAELGSMSNRLSSVIQNLQVSRENTAASNSKIVDADMAKETAENAITKISQSASLAMLKTSNERPELILRLVS
jgi:flagellin